MIFSASSVLGRRNIDSDPYKDLDLLIFYRFHSFSNL